MKLWRSQEGATIVLLSLTGYQQRAAKVLEPVTEQELLTGVTVDPSKSTTLVQRQWESLVVLVTEGSVWMLAG